MTKCKGIRRTKYVNREIDWKDRAQRNAYKRDWQRNARAQYDGKHDMVRAGEIVDYKPLPVSWRPFGIQPDFLEVNPDKGEKQ